MKRIVPARAFAAPLFAPLLALALGGSAFLGGCTFMAEQSGRLLDGSALAEKTLERYRTESGDMELRRVRYRKPSGNGGTADTGETADGTEALVLTLAAWPTLRFRFVQEGESVYAASYTFLATGVSGWNEFTVDLSGGGNITAENPGGENPGGESADGETIPGGPRRLLLALEAPEETDLSAGGIRRFDTRLSGEAALTALRNRRERIAALTEWMAGYSRAASEAAGESPAGAAGETNAAASGESPARRFTGRREFEKYWKPILFSAGLPEHLAPLRDSETLLDDWEEASAWIHLAFEWDHIIQMITTPTTFIKK
ncbi:MAG: hypothetical protein LBD09_01170 [Treponema sp.]|jgi:hypothetical protein|nr:hypothetical protein [Treponema sp.]